MLALFPAKYLGSFNPVMSFSFAQMELDRSADPPPAIWVSTTKSSVNKWVSTRDTSERSLSAVNTIAPQSFVDGDLYVCVWPRVMPFNCNPVIFENLQTSFV